MKLTEAYEMVLADVRGIGFTEFGKEDVVRHPLVARIVEAYDREDARRRAPAPAVIAPEALDEATEN